MNKHDDLRNKYKVLSEVKVPYDVKERINKMINESAGTVSRVNGKKPSPVNWMRSVATAAACVVVVSGVYSMFPHHPSTPNKATPTPKAPLLTHSQSGPQQSPLTHGQTGAQQAAPTWGIPANIAWNGYYYATKGSIAEVGSELGVATYPGPGKVFRIPGKNPGQAVALEVDTPYAKYVSAVRMPIGTKTSPIPSNWISLNSPNVFRTVQPGETLSVLGTVFFRELYGTTITLELVNPTTHERESVSSKSLRVSQSGTFSEKVVLPKSFSPSKHNIVLLVFRNTSKKYPTTVYDFPLMFKQTGRGVSR